LLPVTPDAGINLRKLGTKRQTKRTMWFNGQRVPILYSSDRKDLFLSEAWRPKGAIQKIAASMFAAFLFILSITLLFASTMLRREILQVVPGILGLVSGFALALLVFLVGGAVLFVAIRLVRVTAQSFHKSR
jgi:hypothetical protein